MREHQAIPNGTKFPATNLNRAHHPIALDCLGRDRFKHARTPLTVAPSQRNHLLRVAPSPHRRRPRWPRPRRVLSIARWRRRRSAPRRNRAASARACSAVSNSGPTASALSRERCASPRLLGDAHFEQAAGSSRGADLGERRGQRPRPRASRRCAAISPRNSGCSSATASSPTSAAVAPLPAPAARAAARRCRRPRAAPPFAPARVRGGAPPRATLLRRRPARRRPCAPAGRTRTGRARP